MPKLAFDITEAQAERLAWLGKNLEMAGIKASPSEVVGVLIMTVQRDALEAAFAEQRTSALAD
jgi:hypothetical protein